ncbi:MAG: alpha/beta fold hydrolase [Acidimicrobiales bacterium]
MSMSPGTGPPAGARRLEVTGGVGLHCLEWGGAAGAGPVSPVPFLLVHGLASNCRTWEAVGSFLAARGHPVAAVDQRGHGLSDTPDEGYDFATLCDDLGAVLEALEYDRAVVVGQSTGGNIVVELARRAGHRLAGVAGIDGGTLELQDRWPDWDDCAAALAPPRLAGTRVEAMRAMLRRSHPDWDDWGIEATLANLEVRDDGTVAAHLSFDHHLRILRALWEHRPSLVFPDLDVPVLLITADSGDAWSSDKRAATDRATKLLRRGRSHWISPADHDIHVQKPELVANLLLEAVDDGFFAP